MLTAPDLAKRPLEVPSQDQGYLSTGVYAGDQSSGKVEDLLGVVNAV